MQSSIQHPLDAPVALAFASILIDQTRSMFKDEMPTKNVEVNSDYFIDGTFDYMHFDRVGGVLSHLRKFIGATSMLGWDQLELSKFMKMIGKTCGSMKWVCMRKLLFKC